MYFPVWPSTRLVSAGLEPVLSHTEKSCIATNYRQFFTNFKMNIMRFKPVLLARAFGLSGKNITTPPPPPPFLYAVIRPNS